MANRWDEDVNVRIPIRIVGGHVNLYSGGRLPELEENAVGDLILPSWGIRDKPFLAKLTQERYVPLLDAGRVVLLGVKPDGVPEKLREHLVYASTVRIIADLAFVRTILVDDLQLKLRGTKPAQLMPTEVLVPALRQDAGSLNQAYTMISEAFELERKSHTGNVFKLAYYQSGPPGKPDWRCLDELRKAREEEFEQKLLGASKSEW